MDGFHHKIPRYETIDIFFLNIFKMVVVCRHLQTFINSYLCCNEPHLLNHCVKKQLEENTNQTKNSCCSSCDPV